MKKRKGYRYIIGILLLLSSAGLLACSGTTGSTDPGDFLYTTVRDGCIYQVYVLKDGSRYCYKTCGNKTTLEMNCFL